MSCIPFMYVAHLWMLCDDLSSEWHAFSKLFCSICLLLLYVWRFTASCKSIPSGSLRVWHIHMYIRNWNMGCTRLESTSKIMLVGIQHASFQYDLTIGDLVKQYNLTWCVGHAVRTKPTLFFLAQFTHNYTFCKQQQRNAPEHAVHTLSGPQLAARNGHLYIV